TRAVIDDAVKTGFNVLRFWLFQNRETALMINKLNEICDMVHAHGIKLIVSLADKWGYLQNYNIDEQWYKSAYKKGYLKYVKEVTAACRLRDEIMIWELINEPETDSFDSFFNFVKHTSEEIKSVNPNHLLSLGTVGGIGDKFGSRFSIFRKSNFRKLYSLPSLDAVSLHDYSYDSGIFERLGVLHRFRGNIKRAKFYEKAARASESSLRWIDNLFLKRNSLVHLPITLRAVWNFYNKMDIRFAKEIAKPVYIGEAGFKKYIFRSRKKILELDIREKFSMGVRGYVLWSFESQGWNNDGHGYGFGINDGFEEIVKKWNNEL
ncbi:MAG: cellulase family glycosylhydrolase, partial [Ignavibacteria bacterium]